MLRKAYDTRAVPGAVAAVRARASRSRSPIFAFTILGEGLRDVLGTRPFDEGAALGAARAHRRGAPGGTPTPTSPGSPTGAPLDGHATDALL